MSSTMVYSDVLSRFRVLLQRTLPANATVAVVSRGDGELLRLEEIEAWHFPQRGDGVYLGYYPPDSAAAIQHLEALRAKGAEFLAIPANSLWWLEHYAGLTRHLEDRYKLIVDEEDACAIYALVEDHGAVESASLNGANGKVDAAPPQSPEVQALTASPEQVLDDARALFHLQWYSEQVASTFDAADEALAHYLEVGHLEGLSPHPLFDTRWYAAHHPQVGDAGLPALLHFLEHGARDRLDPSPWFDTAYYYEQRPNLRKEGVNALVHYAANAEGETAAHPNPFFRDRYYLRTYADVSGSGMLPFEHFLRRGRAEGRYASHIHRNIFNRLRQASIRSLTRDNWKLGTAVLFARDAGEGIDAQGLAERLRADYGIEADLLTFRRGPGGDAADADPKPLVLEDYELACEIFRPSALRLLASTLGGQRPAFAVSDVPDVIGTLAGSGIPTFFVAENGALGAAAAQARRVVVPSGAAAQAARRLGARASVCAPGKKRTAALGKLIARELKLPRPNRGTNREKIRRVLIPCPDWNVSGVNVALEAVGKQLIGHGWEVEIVFTRNRDAVLESAGDEAHLPSLPYRFLERARPGVVGMWEALISDVQRTKPCILFLAYDFIGNCVAPALGDDIGVVSWVQADDGDYYEQAYRLGRYCNAVVCVSSHIRDTVTAHNPAVGERAQVIHNSSVSRDDVLRRRPQAASPMRLIYTGRLVQYQKRVLDYVELAHALDRTGVPYELSLIGSFVDREGSQAKFESKAREHLADGRIRLPGRMSRAQIFKELSAHAFFVLLSDFEGLPLALVEAMARGCVPVVAESDSGIPELVTDGQDGLLVSGRDYDRWAELLLALWEDRPALAEMSRRARSTVVERFTVESIGNQFDELFRGVATEIASGYQRPPALHWGLDRSPTGDVLAPPSLFRPAVLQQYPGLT
ncbi:MAG TPA: glycosyltransferase family 4 protein [Solirubrobacterales bacterium]